MQVWDTAGQERFRTITQSYYRSAHGAMVAYDITRRGTFESVPHWIREVEHYGAASVVMILIGEQNKNMLLSSWSGNPKTYLWMKSNALSFLPDIPLQYLVISTTPHVPYIFHLLCIIFNSLLVRLLDLIYLVSKNRKWPH